MEALMISYLVASAGYWLNVIRLDLRRSRKLDRFFAVNVVVALGFLGILTAYVAHLASR